MPEISSFRIDPDTGGLTQSGTVSPEAAPTFLSTDRKGRFLLSAYYQGAHAAVHPLGDDGAVGGPPIEWLETATGAHAMQTDPSNKFAFVPHIAGNGPNAIFQFRFDENTGHLTPNSPLKVEPEEHLGPRHFCFHPTQGHPLLFQRAGLQCHRLSSGHVYGNAVGFSNDHHPAGRVHRKEHLLPDSNLPLGEIPVRSQPRPQQHCVLLRRRLHGRLTAIGHVATEAVPNAFSLDPEGNFLFAAGAASGRLASYRVNGDTGELTPLETYAVGKRPMWVLVTRLGG